MTAPASDAERWMRQVKSRHELALRLARRSDGSERSYRSAYRLLKENDEHPTVDQRLALQRALGADR